MGHSSINADGFNATVTTSKAGVWAQEGAINWPSTASVMNVTSDDTADDAGSTGMTSVTIYGLDANWDPISETVTLDGRTIATTNNSFIRVHRAVGATFGSGATNAGTVYVFTGTATLGTPTTSTAIYTTIDAGEGESLQAFYTVPRNHNGYLLDAYVNSFIGGTEYVAIRLETRANANGSTAGWTTVEKYYTDGQLYTMYAQPKLIPAYTDVMFTAAAQTTSRSVSCGFNLMLIKDIR
jgi:hypothetical protein